MRLLLVTDRLSDRGGAEHYFRDLRTGLRDMGHEVRIVAGSVASDLDVDFDLRVVRGLGSAIETKSRLGGLAALLPDADRIIVQNVMNPIALRSLAETGRAIFVVQDHRHFCPSIGKTLPDGSPCTNPLAFEACGPCVPDTAYLQRSLELTMARTEALKGSPVVVLSSYIEGELAALGLEGITVIPPGFVAEGEPGRMENRDGFLLAGRLVHHKDPLMAVRAWRESGTSQPLRVAGLGSLASEIEREARRGSGSLEMLGWLPREALHREFLRTRALLFPGRWQEPFGMLGPEALIHGVPVVVGVGGGTLEWSDEGCIRVAPGDVAETSRAIRRLSDDPLGAYDLGMAGRRVIANRFSPSSFGFAWSTLVADPSATTIGSGGRG